MGIGVGIGRPLVAVAVVVAVHSIAVVIEGQFDFEQMHYHFVARVVVHFVPVIVAVAGAAFVADGSTVVTLAAVVGDSSRSAFVGIFALAVDCHCIVHTSGDLVHQNERELEIRPRQSMRTRSVIR